MSFTQLLATYTMIPLWMKIALITWFVAWCFCSIHCLKVQQGIDRLTWLTAIIGLPVLGLLLYLIMGIKWSSRDPFSSGKDALTDQILH